MAAPSALPGRADELSPFRLAAFTAPALTIAALGLPLAIYLPHFYTAELGLSLGAVGTVFMIARLWDAFIDPVMGILGDRTTSRFGRRRIWIVASVPILVVSIYMLFSPAGAVSPLYLLVWLVVLYVGWTALNISHIAWGAELSTDYDRRSTILGWREFALVLGMLLLLSLPSVIERTGWTGEREKIALMGWSIIILLPITVAAAALLVSEKPYTPTLRSAGWKPVVQVVASNRLLQRVLLADLLQGLGTGVTSALNFFLMRDVLGLDDSASLLLLAYFVAGLLGVPLWIRISHRVGKHRALAYSMLWSIAVLPAMFLVPRGAFLPALAINVVYGVAYGAAPFLLRSIIADVTDYDTVRTGVQRTGLYISLLVLTNKAGIALAVGLAFPLLEYAGFTPKAANSQATLDHVRQLFVIGPVICFAIVAAIIWRFPLTAAKQREIRSQLDRAAAQ
jgi:Na+/melibiose symporter-like transporter